MSLNRAPISEPRRIFPENESNTAQAKATKVCSVLSSGYTVMTYPQDVLECPYAWCRRAETRKMTSVHDFDAHMEERHATRLSLSCSTNHELKLASNNGFETALGGPNDTEYETGSEMTLVDNQIHYEVPTERPCHISGKLSRTLDEEAAVISISGEYAWFFERQIVHCSDSIKPSKRPKHPSHA
jgi:hypothetical protein